MEPILEDVWINKLKEFEKTLKNEIDNSERGERTRFLALAKTNVEQVIHWLRDANFADS